MQRIKAPGSGPCIELGSRREGGGALAKPFALNHTDKNWYRKR